MRPIHTPLLLLLLSAAASGQQTLKRVLPIGAMNHDHSGFSVATHRGMAIVGSPDADENGVIKTGSAFLFDTRTGARTGRLVASDGAAFDLFGHAVAISGNTAVVGATGANAVYVYDVTTKTELRKLTPNDPNAPVGFGVSVAIDDEHVIVGAPYENSVASKSGAAYVYNLGTGRVLQLLPDDLQGGDVFGIKVAIRGKLAAVSAVGSDAFGVNAGTVYVMDLESGRVVTKLFPQSSAQHFGFGDQISIDGELVVVGEQLSSRYGFHSGAAYLFDARTGEELVALVGSNTNEDDLFGCSVSISGNTVVVGARVATKNFGSAYVFDASSGHELEFLRATGRTGDDFGRSVAIDADSIVIGSPYHDGAGWNAGAAFSYSTAAMSNVRNGTGANAVILSEVRGATVGGAWKAELDCSGHQPGLAALVLQSAPASGIFLRGGEVLIDLTGPRLGVLVLPHTGGTETFSLSIPDPLFLYGANAAVQGVVFGAPGYELSNAIDFTVGR